MCLCHCISVNVLATMVWWPWHPAAHNPNYWSRLYEATLDILRTDTGQKIPGLPG